MEGDRKMSFQRYAELIQQKMVQDAEKTFRNTMIPALQEELPKDTGLLRDSIKGYRNAVFAEFPAGAYGFKNIKVRKSWNNIIESKKHRLALNLKLTGEMK